MQYITSELVNIFNFLLPGFITSFLFYSLTSFPKKSEFELIIMALIYTIVINSLVDVINNIWLNNYKVLLSVFFASFLGILLAGIYNNDLLHRILRKIKITNKTSYPSEWYGTFSESKSYVVLHMKDGRRIMGWPLEWPSSPINGHFVLQDAVWLANIDTGNEEIELKNVEKILLDSTLITMVEFIKPTEESNEP